MVKYHIPLNSKSTQKILSHLKKIKKIETVDEKRAYTPNCSGFEKIDFGDLV